MTEKIFDTTEDKEYYQKLLYNRYKFSIAVSLFMIIVFVISAVIVVAPSENLPPIANKILIIMLVSGAIVIGLSIPYFNHRIKETLSRKIGVRVDKSGIHIFFYPFDSSYSFNEIEFVFIDEAIVPTIVGMWSYPPQYVVIKTNKTPPLKITEKLLKNPKKFWSKIPPKEISKNGYDIKFFKDINAFVDALLTYGVKVYWRRKGSDYIEEVVKRE